jgi:xylan 1,4-beta-xylosidase
MHSNLGASWAAMDGGEWPTDEQWATLRAAEDLQDLEPAHDVAARDGTIEIDFDLPMPAISLLELFRT